MHLLLPYFIIIIVLIQLKLRKNSKKEANSLKSFWEKESKANSVRKKNIANLDYITIPDDMSYETLETSDSDIIKARNTLLSFKSKKMLNLTGFSNTDLKMEYGVANLTDLSAYDDNFADYIKAVLNLGKILMERGYTSEAIEVLELGIACKTDISSNYTLLADYYCEQGDKEGIRRLIHTAKELKSMNKDLILSKLREKLDTM